ncbi:hypothetical protein B0T16DRAFT_451973 [Cercophora newfieldiana]|uniref:Uncharacterized protein n=1 Tax=Cercophora newfieldiana TaxID=92897 RepID=A0AA39YPN6_9PEZI|nr:hypothetical protein B0T16DRAFT_451973 [Cercophora newfieldiana]
MTTHNTWNKILGNVQRCDGCNERATDGVLYQCRKCKWQTCQFCATNGLLKALDAGGVTHVLPAGRVSWTPDHSDTTPRNSNAGAQDGDSSSSSDSAEPSIIVATSITSVRGEPESPYEPSSSGTGSGGADPRGGPRMGWFIHHSRRIEYETHSRAASPPTPTPMPRPLGGAHGSGTAAAGPSSAGPAAKSPHQPSRSRAAEILRLYKRVYPDSDDKQISTLFQITSIPESIGESATPPAGYPAHHKSHVSPYHTSVRSTPIPNPLNGLNAGELFALHGDRDLKSQMEKVWAAIKSEDIAALRANRQREAARNALQLLWEVFLLQKARVGLLKPNQTILWFLQERDKLRD